MPELDDHEIAGLNLFDEALPISHVDKAPGRSAALRETSTSLDGLSVDSAFFISVGKHFLQFSHPLEILLGKTLLIESNVKSDPTGHTQLHQNRPLLKNALSTTNPKITKPGVKRTSALPTIEYGVIK
jgi:hypothetical protein